ncbi:MAG: hypothetical protein R2838_13965 [Caldilineaceae bacterium]
MDLCACQSGGRLRHHPARCWALRPISTTFLTFDSGLKVRVKAEWIKHMDGIVEYYTSISGDEGTVIYNKRPGFGVQESLACQL